MSIEQNNRNPELRAFGYSALKNCAVLLLLSALSCASTVAAAKSSVIRSSRASRDVSLQTIPASRFWRDAPGVIADADSHGHPVPGYRTEIRSRWTQENLYLLFICPYKELYLKPGPDLSAETNKLWNWDVAEAFIGSDFHHVRHYKEFELSPRGEWVDLDIELDKPQHEDGWTWNSGFKVSARIDRAQRVWYGAMRIPYSSIDSRPAVAGNTLRVNFFRSQGPPPRRKEVAWRAPMTDTFHTPERFGLLKLVK
jgi:hypothetical protein